MQIVWDKTAIEDLKKKHTVLELETFDVKGTSVSLAEDIARERIVMAVISSKNPLAGWFSTSTKKTSMSNAITAISRSTGISMSTESGSAQK